jgi:uncharacterized protein (DUF488 family)
MPSDPTTQPSPTIYTIGHSTRSFEGFARILQAHGVRAIADVRQFPRSRRFPHFNDESLSAELPKLGIQYIHMKPLGGRRKPLPDSINTAWRNNAFRGYADYMQTPEFQSALHELMQFAQQQPTATMCAEAVPWRCHRNLISDALIAHGWRVLDIYDEKSIKEHALAPFAIINGTTVTYPDKENLFEPR